jgi:hypothetical protein
MHRPRGALKSRCRSPPRANALVTFEKTRGERFGFQRQGDSRARELYVASFRLTADCFPDFRSASRSNSTF